MTFNLKDIKPELGPIADRLRASPLLIIFLIAFSVTVWLAPVKVGLTIWGVSKLALGGYIGYWVDRVSFRPESRPHRLEGIARGASEKRRAWIIAAAIIGASLLP